MDEDGQSNQATAQRQWASQRVNQMKRHGNGAGLNRRSLIAFVGLVGIAALLSGCGESTYKWNQKLTITVQTPQGEKSGSAVVGIKARHTSGPFSEYKLNGEAAVVDLGNGKYLFATLGQLDRSIAALTFQVEETPPEGNEEDVWGVISGMQGRKKELPSGFYPLLVTFSNLKYPKSVKRVANVSEAFGSGYSLKSMTLEITDEPVTKGVVEKVLPWIRQYDNKLFDGDTTRRYSVPYNLANSLGSENFVVDDKEISR
jgi:hypothetical protein